MSNQKEGPRELESLSPEDNITIISSSRQETKQGFISTAGSVLKKGGKVVASAGVVALPFVSFFDYPKEVSANSANFTLISGEGGISRYKIGIFRVGMTTERATKVGSTAMFNITPTDQFKDITDLYLDSRDHSHDFGCNQAGHCNFDVVREATKSAGFHAGLVVIEGQSPNNWLGNAEVPDRNLPRSINGAAVTIPYNANLDDPNDIKPTALVIARELWGHVIGGYHDNEDNNDLMTKIITWPFFNDRHTQDLTAIRRITPFNHLTPQPEIRSGSFRSQGLQSVMRLENMDLSAVIISPLGTKQLKWAVYPAPNIYSGQPDGPAVEMIYGDTGLIHGLGEAGQRIPAPKMGEGPYLILPDMTYTWKACPSGLEIPLPFNSEKWEEVEIWPGKKLYVPCQTLSMRTPKTNPDTISLLTNGVTTNDLTPTLRFGNSDPRIFYYEVQVSKDPTFNGDPATATSMLYSELKHGAMTTPQNSYTIPDNFPLEPGQDYYWRVRPRVQGDGTPTGWKEGSFSTSADARILSYSEGLVDQNYGNGVIGPSKTDYDTFAGAYEPLIEPSPLARVYETASGSVFIPEERN